jgi:hypothetical protein
MAVSLMLIAALERDSSELLRLPLGPETSLRVQLNP